MSLLGISASARTRAPGARCRQRGSSSSPSSWLAAPATRAWRSNGPRRPLRRDRVGPRAGAGQHLAAGAEQHDLARVDLFAHALQRQRPDELAVVGQPFGRQPRLGHQVGAQRIERAAAERQAGVERAGHLGVEPGLDAARDELHRHRVDQHAGHHADEREDAGQLDQQAAAEFAAAQSNRRAAWRRSRSPAAAPRRPPD